MRPATPCCGDAPGDAVGHDAQEVVTAAMAEGVVDRLEPIEIENSSPTGRSTVAVASSPSSVSNTPRRLSNPVSGSCVAWWVSCSMLLAS